MIIIGGKYKHFKGGQYEVLAVAKHSENGEEMVVYKALYSPCDVWVRPIGMFEDRVERDGYSGPRFVKIA